MCKCAQEAVQCKFKDIQFDLASIVKPGSSGPEMIFNRATGLWVVTGRWL